MPPLFAGGVRAGNNLRHLRDVLLHPLSAGWSGAEEQQAPRQLRRVEGDLLGDETSQRETEDIHLLETLGGALLGWASQRPDRVPGAVA